MKRQAHELRWTDEDGDAFLVTDDEETIGGTNNVCAIELCEGDGPAAVYVNEEDARRLIDYLTERLRER